MSRFCSVNQPSDSSSLLVPNHLFGNQFPDTANLCPFLDMRNELSHPYKSACKIAVLYALIFIVLDNRRKDERL
jgi:hypothetical protein